MLSPVSFRIPTLWHVRGRIEDVGKVLSRTEDFPRWWSDVYLSCRTVKAGDTNRFLFRLLAPFCRWLMISNHRWAMERGERGLQAELDRLGKHALPAVEAARA
jgi:hypothetical protein